MKRTILITAISFALAVGCSSPQPPATSQTPSNQQPSIPASAEQPAIDVIELSISQAMEQMTAGTLTSVQLTQAYLDRINQIDRNGPKLNAVIELNASAIEDAKVRDQERKHGKPLSKLHGIPVLIKDNIDIVGMVNSAGSVALAEHRPSDDAFLVQRLRASGAVILGKTNLSEWANFRSTRSISGWSSRGGQTRNPYVLDRSPCGSSSGTGAAIAASLASAGIGTETDGSILCPSAVSGLVGLKPTVGTVSRDGIIPISSTQDTAGPMARSVADAALLFEVIAGIDVNDPASKPADGKLIDNYTNVLDTDALRGRRIGVLRQATGYHPELDTIFNASIEKMRMLGAEIIDPVKIDTWQKWNDAEYEVLLYEFKYGLNAYLRASNAPINKSLEELIEWNKNQQEKVMPWFAQEIFYQAQSKGPLTDKAYLEARTKAAQLAGAKGLFAALKNNQLDALIAPTTGPAWVVDPINGDHFGGAGYGAAAVAGSPSITVPMGHINQLPVGISFLGAPFSEEQLLGFAFAFEQAARARKPPQFVPTLPP